MWSSRRANTGRRDQHQRDRGDEEWGWRLRASWAHADQPSRHTGPNASAGMPSGGRSRRRSSSASSSAETSAAQPLLPTCADPPDPDAVPEARLDRPLAVLLDAACRRPRRSASTSFDEIENTVLCRRTQSARPIAASISDDQSVIVSLHVATGAAMGTLVRSRSLALLLGPPLHVAGDQVPHEDIPDRSFEIGSGLVTLGLLAARRGPLDPAVLGGAAARRPTSSTSCRGSGCEARSSSTAATVVTARASRSRLSSCSPVR